MNNKQAVRTFLLVALGLAPAIAYAANAGDFAGGVAVGSTFAGTAAPTDGLIVKGRLGINTTTPDQAFEINGVSHFGNDIDLTRTDGFAIGSFVVDNVITKNIAFQKLGGGNVDGLQFMATLTQFTGEVSVGTLAAGPGTALCINSGVLSGCSSSIRYKENVRPAHMGLHEVLQMRPVIYDFKNHPDNWERHEFGFIAEEMVKINPLFVTYDKSGEINGVRYMQLTAVEAAAIQDLNKTIETQQSEIEELKRAVAELSRKRQPTP